MLFQKNQKKISSILRNIYKPSLNERDIDHLKDQIIQIIKRFNQFAFIAGLSESFISTVISHFVKIWFSFLYVISFKTNLLRIFDAPNEAPEQILRIMSDESILKGRTLQWFLAKNEERIYLDE